MTQRPESGHSKPELAYTAQDSHFSAAAGTPKSRGISSFMRGLPPLGAEGHRMDVAAWLRGLGLEQYVPAFRDNDVDGEVLPEPAGDDLVGPGGGSVRHRR